MLRQCFKHSGLLGNGDRSTEIVEDQGFGSRVKDQIACSKALDQAFDGAAGFLSPESVLSNFAHRRGIDELNPAGDAVRFVRANFAPVQVVPHEIVRQEKIVVNQQESTDPGTCQRNRNLAPEGTTPDNGSFSCGEGGMALIKAGCERLRWNSGYFKDRTIVGAKKIGSDASFPDE